MTRPTSLAWEVRKSSPGKALFSSAGTVQPSVERNSPSPVRSLDFNSQCSSLITQQLSNPSGMLPTQSWADKVRGTTLSGSKSPTIASGSQSDANGSCDKQEFSVESLSDEGDNDGWETVHRGRKAHGNSIKKATKLCRQQASDVDRRIRALSQGNKDANAACTHTGTTVSYGSVATHPSTEPPEVPREVVATYPAHTGLSNAVEEDSLSDMERERALSAAVEQEESLSRQMEECQERTIASVIEHEESLTKEIAEEEELVTALNGRNGSLSSGDCDDDDDLQGDERNEDSTLASYDGVHNDMVSSVVNGRCDHRSYDAIEATAMLARKRIEPLIFALPIRCSTS